MIIREELEQREYEYLSPYATYSKDTLGREREEIPCDIRTEFQRDRDRILHCKSFRRLKQKTQVFLLPKGDHYRTRMTHTLEVAQIARTIAKALRMNEDLVEAIALGHDLGHTPFGHAGERALAAVCPLGFKHNKQSVRVVERLEKEGKGLNLTREVRDGILTHQTSSSPHTLEGKIVRLSDKMAYIHHDMDDAMRGGILLEEDVPERLRRTLGMTTKERLNTMVHDVIISSKSQNDITMSKDILEAFQEIRKFMFDYLYTNPKAKSEEVKAIQMIEQLYEHYNLHPGLLPKQYRIMMEDGEKKERVVCDFISGMTDNYSVKMFQEFFVPKSWQI